MSGENLPPEVKQFIFTHLSTIEELEILILLANGGSKQWTAETIYHVILSSRPSIEKGMEKFAAAGLLVKSEDVPPGYLFTAGDDEATIRDLIRCYREAPVRVIETIYQKSRDSVQGFADAFKIKREP